MCADVKPPAVCAPFIFIVVCSERATCMHAVVQEKRTKKYATFNIHSVVPYKKKEKEKKNVQARHLEVHTVRQLV